MEKEEEGVKLLNMSGCEEAAEVVVKRGRS